MSRLPLRPRGALEPEGQKVFDDITATRPGVIDADGALIGPFNAWVTAPRIGGRLADLGASLRFDSSIERRLLEVAIITVGAHWRSEFEFWAHSRMAIEHGVDPAAVDAIARGVAPDLPEDERLIHDLARQLVTTGRLTADDYAAGRELLGDRGLVELVTLCGYYTLVSISLNAFAVALPPGVEPTWPDTVG